MGVLESAIAKAWKEDPEATKTMLSLALADIDDITDPAAVADAGAQLVAHRVAIAKRGLGRAYAEQMAAGKYPDEEPFMKTAQWLADLDLFAADLAGLPREILGEDVAKAYETWSQRGTKLNWAGQVSRDRGGRFSSKSGSYGRMPVSSFAREYERGGRLVPKNAMGSTVVQDEDRNWALAEGADKDRAEKWFGDYFYSARQADSMLSQSRDLGGGKDEDAKAWVLLEGDGGNKKRVVRSIGDFKNDAWGDEFDEGMTPTEVGLDFKDAGNAQRMASYNAFSSLGMPKGVASALSASGEGGQPNWVGLAQSMGGNGMTSDGRQLSRSEQMFQRSENLGRAIEDVPGMGTVSDVLSTIGNTGPEVQRALQPSIERTAGRYQGKERAVDTELSGVLGDKAVANYAGIASNPELFERFISSVADADSRGRTGRGQEDFTTKTILANDNKYKQGSPDQAVLGIRSDVAADYFIDHLPDAKLARVSQLSGQVLPSTGVVIDAKGRPAQQSQGLSDDHYLPFTPKGLSSLRNGQYVRTRVAGGLTTEDVNALMTTGARKVTVVSRSGVFSLELDPNAQGSGKTAQMGRRMADNYERILDAVAGSGEYLRDLPYEQKLQIEAEVRSSLYTDDPEAIQQAVSARMEQERSKGEKLTLEEITGLKDQAEERAREQFGDTVEPSVVNEIFNQLESEAMKSKTMKLRLNAEGYGAAIATLQQQFPYLIREASFEPLDQFYANRGMSERSQAQARMIQSERAEDAGYVGIGETRAPSGRNTPGARRPAKGKEQQADEATPTGSSSPQVDAAAAAPEGDGGAPAAPTTGGAASPDSAGASGMTPMDALIERNSSNLAQRRNEYVQKLGVLKSVEEKRPQSREPININSINSMSNEEFIRAWLIGTIETEGGPVAFSEKIGSTQPEQLRIAEAFSDQRALNGVLQSGIFEYQAIGSSPVAGFDNWEDLSVHISSVARDLADTEFLSNGSFFDRRDPSEASSTKIPKPVFFADMANLMNGSSAAAYLNSSTPGAVATKAGLSQLAPIVGPEQEQRSLLTISRRVNDKVKSLKLAEKLVARLNSAQQSESPGIILSEVASANGVKPGDLSDSLGIDPNVWNAATPREVSATIASAIPRPEQARKQTEELQRAFTMYSTVRSLQLLGGGVDPKAWGSFPANLALPLLGEETAPRQFGKSDGAPNLSQQLANLDQAERLWQRLTA